MKTVTVTCDSVRIPMLCYAPKMESTQQLMLLLFCHVDILASKL
jgi:hypothetical protein